MARHREVCGPCAESETEGVEAFDLLRSAFIEPEVAPQFDERLIRRIRTQRVKEGFRYWAPAVIGASLACLSLFAAISLIGRANILPSIRPVGQASGKFVNPQVGHSTEFPSLDLSQPPHLDR